MLLPQQSQQHCPRQGITTITADAFAGCVNLDSVSMSNSVTAIDGSAFAGCHSLANITIPASVTTIADDAFANAGVLSATFNGNAPTVGTSIFVARTGFTVKFYAGATGFGDPIWLTSSNETYPATTLAATQSISFPAIPTQVYPGTGTVPPQRERHFRPADYLQRRIRPRHHLRQYSKPDEHGYRRRPRHPTRR